MIVRRTWSIGRILAAILVVMALVSCVLLIAGYGVWTRAKAQDGGTEVVNVTETPAPPVETEAPASTEAPPAPDATEAPEVTEPAEASALAPGFDFKSLDGSQNVRNDHSFHQPGASRHGSRWRGYWCGSCVLYARSKTLDDLAHDL